jgi:uncharacterized membrane protein YkvA (DUF1232 family)
MGKFWSYWKVFRYDLIVLLMAFRNPGTPGFLKGAMVLAGLYLISPVDLIPDAIPVLGLMDDAVIVPMVLGGVLKLLPPVIRDDSERKALRLSRRLPYVFLVASIVILLWVLLLLWAVYALLFK